MLPVMNFREFIETTTSGAMTSDAMMPPTRIDLDFPTKTVHGEVFRVKVQGANYCIYITGGTTILIPRNTYHKKYNRLPREKTKNHPGDMVTAVFYKYKAANQENYSLKGFQINSLR